MSTVPEYDRVEISIAIPTFGRGKILLDTLRYLLQLPDSAEEILVVDQTAEHEAATESELGALDRSGSIKWIRQERPSIPIAMNRGLSEATKPVVLFLDDDILPAPGLLAAHAAAHAAYPEVIVAGRVIQPWDEGKDFTADTGFHFASLREVWCEELMEGNFSVPRDLAIGIGGFDENFVDVAYRFGAEFSHRWLTTGRRIRYEPAACIHHLKVPLGGTRIYGEHLTTLRPTHSVGAYYYYFRTRVASRAIGMSLRRLGHSVTTRHHLRRPWWIPLTFLAELRGLWLATQMVRAGPRYMDPSERRRN